MSFFETNLNNVELGGGNVKGIDVGCKTGEGLLGTVGAMKCVSAVQRQTGV